MHPISDAIPLDQAALIEPLSVGHHAYTRSGAKAGDVALVGGAGPIGLLLSAILKAKGLTVVITELSAKRKQKARESGVADHILDPSEVNVVAEVMKLTGGKGVDVSFERAQRGHEAAGRARHHCLLQRPPGNHQAGRGGQDQPRALHHPVHPAR
ncbi:zinc-binding dehydrogenase [Delftia lacustris]|uniref:zinc-binding dehydrogenase n=1 Tax=Delftia lacustris TaxID=558537 RepID=UPI000A4CEA4E|nr:zinc-binding dehydrogenase [Delftia lacustris]